MALKKVQKDVHEWVSQYKIPYWSPLSIMARLTEETGELAREVNNRYGDRVRKSEVNKKDIGNEIADIIFTVTCLANSLDIDMSEAFSRVLDKCYGRDKDRYEKK